VLYPIHVVLGAEARVAGLPLAAEMRAFAPDVVDLDLGGAALCDAVWWLPVVDAASVAFPRATFRVRARDGVKELLSAHRPIASQRLHLRGRLRARLQGRSPRRTLAIELSPRATTAELRGAGDHYSLVVPYAPFPNRAQHVSAHAVDGAQMAGLPATFAPPRLRLTPLVAHRGRALARKVLGKDAGPFVVLMPVPGGYAPASYARAASTLTERIGGRVFSVGDVTIDGAKPFPHTDAATLAGALSLAAVCIGDDWDISHLAAASGAPTVILHGPTSPTRTGPLARHGASAFTTRGTCDACRESPGRQCLACLDPARVADLAEELSARRWPLDRLLRLLP
jgi:hypothetical protein